VRGGKTLLAPKRGKNVNFMFGRKPGDNATRGGGQSMVIFVAPNIGAVWCQGPCDGRRAERSGRVQGSPHPIRSPPRGGPLGGGGEKELAKVNGRCAHRI